MLVYCTLYISVRIGERLKVVIQQGDDYNKPQSPYVPGNLQFNLCVYVLPVYTYF